MQLEPALVIWNLVSYVKSVFTLFPLTPFQLGFLLLYSLNHWCGYLFMSCSPLSILSATLVLDLPLSMPKDLLQSSCCVTRKLEPFPTTTICICFGQFYFSVSLGSSWWFHVNMSNYPVMQLMQPQYITKSYWKLKRMFQYNSVTVDN